MRNFLLAFLVFLFWCFLVFWYFSSGVSSSLSGLWNYKAEEEVDSKTEMPEMPKMAETAIAEGVQARDSVSLLILEENSPRLYAVDEKKELLFILDSVFIKKNKDSVYYRGQAEEYLGVLKHHLSANKNLEVIINSDYSANEDFSTPNYGIKRGQFLTSQLLRVGINKNRISVRSFIKDFSFGKDSLHPGGISFIFKTMSPERLEDSEKNNIITRTIYPGFTFASILVNKELREFGEELKLVLENNPDKQVKIIGHTDNIGSKIDNQELGLKYARQVRQYLINNRGIDPKRLRASSRGEMEPIADNNTQTGREKNRRIEFLIE